MSVANMTSTKWGNYLCEMCNKAEFIVQVSMKEDEGEEESIKI